MVEDVLIARLLKGWLKFMTGLIRRAEGIDQLRDMRCLRQVLRLREIRPQVIRYNTGNNVSGRHPRRGKYKADDQWQIPLQRTGQV